MVNLFFASTSPSKNLRYNESRYIKLLLHVAHMRFPVSVVVVVDIEGVFCGFRFLAIQHVKFCANTHQAWHHGGPPWCTGTKKKEQSFTRQLRRIMGSMADNFSKRDETAMGSTLENLESFLVTPSQHK
jgi:hypothetical protein